jgi:hypothetical protein
VPDGVPFMNVFWGAVLLEAKAVMILMEQGDT